MIGEWTDEDDARALDCVSVVCCGACEGVTFVVLESAELMCTICAATAHMQAVQKALLAAAN